MGTIPLQSWRPGTPAVLQTRWCFRGDHKHTTFRPPLLPGRVAANSGSSLWTSLSQAHFSRGSPIFNSQAVPPLCGGQGESKKVALHLCVERCNEQETYTQEACPKWPSQVALHPCLLSLRSLSKGLKGLSYDPTTRSPGCCTLERAPNLGRVGRAHVPRTLELGGPGKEPLIVWSRLVGKPQVTVSSSPPPTLPSTFNILFWCIYCREVLTS